MNDQPRCGAFILMFARDLAWSRAGIEIIKLSVGKQTGVSSGLGPMKLQPQTAVEIDPKAPLFQFTHRIHHCRLAK